MRINGVSEVNKEQPVKQRLVLLVKVAALCLVLIALGCYVRKTFRSTDDASDASFHFDEITEEEAARVRKFYNEQEKGIHSVKQYDAVKLIEQTNSSPLPNRLFNGSAEEICGTTKDLCIHPFVKVLPQLMTAPNYRLMSCVVQKSMSTVMTAIVCFLLREKQFISAGRDLLKDYGPLGFCQGKNNFNQLDNMRKILQINNVDDWRFTMVTREPVDRFLSGFIDRCVRVHDECFGCGTNMTCFLEEEYARAKQFAFADEHQLAKPHLSMEDIHIFPQNWRCSMHKYYRNYEFIRYSSDPTETLLDDLSRILKQQNVSDSAIEYISESLSSKRTLHSTVSTKTRSFLEQRLRGSPYLMELIVRLFYYDYVLLHYPLPDLSSL
ncbi:hypothetical protein Q1695_007446 [Nippostrongylus brasiliensis]|nr:hypothetical protein Q1695_007446 [Nippostrongylus brasiliensis]